MRALRLLSVIGIVFAAVVAEEDVEDVESQEEVPAAEEVPYVTPDIHPKAHFADHFDGSDFEQKWIKSSAKKKGADSGIDKYDGLWAVEQQQKNPLAGDYGLVLKSKAKHAAISARLKKPFTFSEDSLVVQYVINYQAGQDCGGGYLKLYSQSKDLDLNKVTDKTPYTIMFGPDRCGSDSKLHFIFRHVNPKNQTVEEKHCKKLETKERASYEEIFKDKKPHLFRLIVNSDNTYEVSVDYKIVNHGSLLNDFTPAVNPPAEIDDPEDRKPEDWDEREKITDPSASKPDDWDEDAPRKIPDKKAVKPEGWLDNEPEMVPDPDAEKPEDWDVEIDGDWEAPLIDNPECKSAPGCGEWKVPMIDNPDYKGKWYPPMINNPNYKGKWKPKKIPNPDYFHDPEPFKMTPIGAVGIELWSMSEDIYFDDVIVTDSQEVADSWAKETYDLKILKFDANNAGLFKRILAYSNKNPWLYAVYIVVVGLPLVLVITFCCSGDSSGKKADPKKTDEPQPDDREPEQEEPEEDAKESGEEEEEAAEEEAEVAAESTGTRKRRARKE